jgi:hypothetical protein
MIAYTCNGRLRTAMPLGLGLHRRRVAATGLGWAFTTLTVAGSIPPEGSNYGLFAMKRGSVCY